MRFLKFMFVFLVLAGILGAGLYFWGADKASEKIADKVTEHLEGDGQLDRVKKAVNEDPDLKKFVEEGAGADPSTLPFTTKEQAAKTLIKKFSLTDMQELRSKAQNGLTNEEKAELLKKVESKLSPDELRALKAVMYKELNQ